MLTAVLVAAGTLAVQISLRGMLKHRPAELRRESVSPHDPASTGKVAFHVDAVMKVPHMSKYSLIWNQSETPSEITPEIVAAISERITEEFGPQVSIRSARKLRTPAIVLNEWAREGRALVQASHHLQRTGARHMPAAEFAD
jgi:hypothetical protein